MALPNSKLFSGYTTANGPGPETKVYDLELINIDLNTAFNTRIGERVMRPDYGCAIWNYIMEPFTSMLEDQIVAEVQRVCGLDSRLVLQSTTVSATDNGVTVLMLLLYLPLNVVNTFSMTFEDRQAAYFGDTST